MQSKSWCSRAAVFLAGLLAGCSSSGQSGSPGLPEEVKAVVFMQRMALSNAGNVFDYTSYEPGGRIVKLEPPAANGKLTVLTSDPMWDGADFMAWDLSFDAKSIVFAARLKSDAHYQIFSMNQDGTNIRQLTEGDVDHVYPVYLPGQKIFFTTNESVEEGAKQFEDEYERQTTAQVGIMSEDGSNVVLGPRNVSHRVSPTLMPDGRVLYTEWRHLGMVNDGHLRLMNTDMTNMKEAFGGEEGATNGTNSYLKARFVSTYTTPTGSEAYRIVAVGTSRDRTLQSGKVLLISLDKSEKTSSFEDLTPQVPGDRTPSDYGRFYDAEPVGSADDKRFLVSWSLCSRRQDGQQVPRLRRSQLLGRASAADQGAPRTPGDRRVHPRRRRLPRQRDQRVRLVVGGNPQGRRQPPAVRRQGATHGRILRGRGTAHLRHDRVRRTLALRGGPRGRGRLFRGPRARQRARAHAAPRQVRRLGGK
jgi:hypothetical protein